MTISIPAGLSKSTNTENLQQLRLFEADRLPRKPYCSKDKGAFNIRPLLKALQFPYIQVNAPGIKWWMVFDVDRPGAFTAWEEAGLPPPAWVSTNPQTTTGHICYALELPVVTTIAGRAHPLRYLRHVEYGLAKALGADLGYSGLMTKNPTHEVWRTWVGPQRTYLLEEFGEYIDIPKRIPKKALEYSVGRNCDTFEHLRHWAYGHVMKAKAQGTFEAWQQACIREAEQFNTTFKAPMLFPEVKAIGKSVAKWTWANFGSGPAAELFKARQAAKGRIGGLKSGAVRFENSTEAKAPWVALGISRMTYYRRKKLGLLPLHSKPNQITAQDNLST